MNIITAQKLIYQESLSLKAQSVFLYLADRSNKENICWPGLKRIAEDCKISVSTVQRAIRELLKVGLVMRKANFRKNGSQTSNIYIITESESNKEDVKVENKRIQTNMERRRKAQAKKVKLIEEFKMVLGTSAQEEKENEDDTNDIKKENTNLFTLLHKKVIFLNGGSQNDQPITLNNFILLIEKKKQKLKQNIYKIFNCGGKNAD